MATPKRRGKKDQQEKEIEEKGKEKRKGTEEEKGQEMKVHRHQLTKSFTVYGTFKITKNIDPIGKRYPRKQIQARTSRFGLGPLGIKPDTLPDIVKKHTSSPDDLLPRR